eukprot:5201337-Ditylum_brightwellii.AAC.1
MICEHCDQGEPRIKTEPQLAFHTDTRDPQEGDNEIVPPTRGGKVRLWARCDKCNKKGHYANKCPLEE